LEKFESLRRIGVSAGGLVERAFAPIFEAGRLLESAATKSESAPIVNEILSEVAKVKARLGV